jgi:hypothetical protein
MLLRRRDVFLKIEPLSAYGPFAPLSCTERYGRDCMYRDGHELGRLSPQEIIEATLQALAYREYLDPHHSVPNTAKIIEPDVNEPPWNRRIPGAVLYASPGDRLHIPGRIRTIVKPKRAIMCGREDVVLCRGTFDKLGEKHGRESRHYYP